MGVDSPSDLLNHLPDEIRNLLIHRPVLARIREALAAELLLDGVEAFVQVIAVLCDAGASGVRCGCGVHGERERDWD